MYGISIFEVNSSTIRSRLELYIPESWRQVLCQSLTSSGIKVDMVVRVNRDKQAFTEMLHWGSARD
jgi:hypothetical protein